VQAGQLTAGILWHCKPWSISGKIIFHTISNGKFSGDGLPYRSNAIRLACKN